jgi:hypothetical protein
MTKGIFEEWNDGRMEYWNGGINSKNPNVKVQMIDDE